MYTVTKFPVCIKVRLGTDELHQGLIDSYERVYKLLVIHEVHALPMALPDAYI